MRINTIIDTVGNTPLLALNIKEIPAKVFAKVEAYNPGLSAKDRIVRYMVEKAEKLGHIKPGATIVEATSGNTGFALAYICAIKGYRCILTTTSKTSQEKIQQLKALGAEVIICPSVKPDDPRSYYEQAKLISRRIKNAYYLNQNFNTDNQMAHYCSTGPEIWNQSEGKITHFICCAGTGGTISGTAKYLKEKNSNVRVIAVDGDGSVLKTYFETGKYDESVIKPILIEGLGKTIIPGNLNFDVIDHFERVTDKDAALKVRDLAKHQGLFCGYSSGAAYQALFQLKHEFDENSVVVVLFSDHGSRYLSKIYNDLWMQEKGFLPVLEVQEEKSWQTDQDIPIGAGANSFNYYRTMSKSYKRFRRIMKKRMKHIRESLQVKN